MLPRLLSPPELPMAQAEAGHHSCIGVLRVGPRFALQLRDDKPDIPASGFWGLFSGSIEQGERGVQAMQREIREELELEVPEPPSFCFGLWQEFNTFFRTSVCLEAFECDLSPVWGRHRLLEGQAVDLFTWEELPDERMALLSRAVLREWRQDRGPRVG